MMDWLTRMVWRAMALAVALVIAAVTPLLAQHDGVIVAPAAEATVSGAVTIEGTATHPTFRKWQIDLLLNGDADQATFLALGEKPLDRQGKFLNWDTTLYPNGQHLLRLRVVHSNLNYDEVFSPVTIANTGVPTAAEKPAPTTDEAAPDAANDDDAKTIAEPVVFRTDAPPDAERWIEVIISEQKLIAWQGDVPVFETIVSTGKPGWHTLPGEFAVYRKYDETRMRGPGYDTPDVPWTMYYSGGFAIHGAYWHNNFGTPVSHGCVNLRVPEAKALYDWSSVGTRVVVRN